MSNHISFTIFTIVSTIYKPMRNLSFFILILCLTCCSDLTSVSEVPSSVEKMKSRNVSGRVFEFPDIQWTLLDTYSQKLAACQIPDSLISQISTDELVEICMEFPLLLDAYAFQTPLIGLQTMISRFNGFKELLARKDNCCCLFNYLKANDIRLIEYARMDKADIGRKTLIYTLSEYLLSFDEILENSSEALSKEISHFAYGMIEDKENVNSIFSMNSLSASAYLCIKGVLSDYKQSRGINPIIDKLLETGVLKDRTNLQEVKNICKYLMQNN